MEVEKEKNDGDDKIGAEILIGLWFHYQFGKNKDFIVDANSLDFTYTSQKELKITNPQIGESYYVNLFDAGINPYSLAFGVLKLKYEGDNQFSIETNPFDFDYQKTASWQRNAGTFLGSMTVGDIYTAPGGWAAIFRNLLGIGGIFNVVFKGKVYIPE